jgi:hypothetical protein
MHSCEIGKHINRIENEVDTQTKQKQKKNPNCQLASRLLDLHEKKCWKDFKNLVSLWRGSLCLLDTL